MQIQEWETMDLKDFAGTIKKYRAKKNLKQQGFADKANVSYGSIQIAENCKRKLSYVIVVKILNAMED